MTGEEKGMQRTAQVLLFLWAMIAASDGTASSPEAEPRDEGIVRFTVGEDTMTFHAIARVSHDRGADGAEGAEGRFVVVSGMGEHASITIRIPARSAGEYTHTTSAGLHISYTAMLYSSNLRHTYGAGSRIDGTKVTVNVTELGEPGVPVAGTFDALVINTFGDTLHVADGQFSMLLRPSVE